MGREFTDEEIEQESWSLYNKGGKDNDERAKSKQRIYKVNPYRFARQKYSMYIDADQIVQKSMGNDRNERLLAFQMLTDPRVVPYTDQKAVVDDFVIEEFSDGDPDRYRIKENDMNAMMQAAMTGQMGGGPQGVAPLQPVQGPQPLPELMTQ
jgi:hypothetical protein